MLCILSFLLLKEPIFDWPSGFIMKMFENNCHTHLYSPKAWGGGREPLGSNVFRQHKYSVSFVISCFVFPTK